MSVGTIVVRASASQSEDLNSISRRVRTKMFKKLVFTARLMFSIKRIVCNCVDQAGKFVYCVLRQGT